MNLSVQFIEILILKHLQIALEKHSVINLTVISR